MCVLTLAGGFSEFNPATGQPATTPAKTTTPAKSTTPKSTGAKAKPAPVKM
jgi:hypothetical protein